METLNTEEQEPMNRIEMQNYETLNTTAAQNKSCLKKTK